MNLESVRFPQLSRIAVGLVVFAALVALPASARVVPATEPAGAPVAVTPPVAGEAPGATPDLPGQAPNGPGLTPHYKQIPASAFQPRNSTTNVVYHSLGYIYTTTGGFFWAPLDLPAGSLLLGMRLYYYDNDATDGVTVYLTRFDGDAVPTYTDLYATGTTGAPGYGSLYLATGVSGETIRDFDPADNTTEWLYDILVSMPASSDVRFKNVRLYWQQQVAPAPAVAAFADVPTDYWAFKHIEALYASGITAGCGTGPLIYCPEKTITRAEMAVYMAKALGLYWPR